MLKQNQELDQIFKLVFEEFWNNERIEEINGDLIKEFVEEKNEDLVWCLEDIIVKEKYNLDDFLF